MWLRTIGLVLTLALGLLVVPLLADAQQAGKVYRIGFLDFRFRSVTTDPRLAALRQGMSELGYVEGQNFVIEYRSAKGKPERLPEVAAELVQLKVDIIVTAGYPGAIRAAKQASRTIPIVMASSGVDPVEAGFVMSLARPGGNITGLTNRISQLHPKRLELLKEAFPHISRVAVLWNPLHREEDAKQVEAVGLVLGIEIHRIVGQALDDLEDIFSAISREATDALLVSTSPLTLRNRARVIELTAKRRLPAIYDNREFVNAGGLMSYGTSNIATYRRAATYVDRILKGVNPAELPIEEPRKFELVVNLKTAKQLGITIPPIVLFQATKVIR